MARLVLLFLWLAFSAFADDRLFLIVDDQELALDVKERILSRMGFVVERATSADEALDLFRQNPEKYFGVFSDFNTKSRLNGGDFCREAKKLNPRIFFILHTDRIILGEEKTPANREKYVETYGVDMLLAKDTPLTDCREAIRAAVAACPIIRNATAK